MLLSCAVLVPVASAFDPGDNSLDELSEGPTSDFTIRTPENGARLNSSSVEVSWMYPGNDLLYIDLRVDFGEWTVCNDGRITLDLLAGIHIVEVRAHTTVKVVHLAIVWFHVVTFAPTMTIFPTGTDVSVDTEIVATFAPEIYRP